MTVLPIQRKPLTGRFVGMISGGGAQPASLARALVFNPETLFLSAALLALATERRELKRREREIRSTGEARIPELMVSKQRAEHATRAAVEPAQTPKGPPIINFRGEGRRFSKGRCLVPASWFYEFTGKRYPKAKWRFTRTDGDWMCVAGLWRPVGNAAAFTMLTVDPGPDVAPYHNRQVVILDRKDWATWLNLGSPAEHLVQPLPAGSFTVEQVSPGSDA